MEIYSNQIADSDVSGMFVTSWSIPVWQDTVVMPKRWADDVLDPLERGPFHIVHADTPELAQRICRLLNEDGDRHIAEIIGGEL